MARKKKNNTSPTAKDKAALYIRVSTVYQIDKDSLKVQERELIHYTQLVLNMDDYEIFRDAGYSAKNTDRPNYQKMMQKLRTGEFSHLVVWKIDRISRNLLDFAEMYAELKDLSVTFVSKNEQFDTSSAIGEAMLKIILVFAELERQMTSERVTAVMISRAESGSWNGGKVPLGYTYDKETKSFGIHPEQAEVVRLIYDSYERMQSSTAVAKFLNEKGITTKAGNKWNPSTVCLILRNPVYKGTMVYNKRHISVTGKLKPEDEWVTVEEHHAAIISAEQFERCHTLLKKNMIGSDRSTYFRGNCHVLAGLLFCDYCGSMMAAQIGKPLKSKGGIIPSNYSCYNKRHGLCENPFTSDSTLGPFILNYVANMYRIQRTFGKTTSIETLEKKLLRGEAFKEVEHIEAKGLTQLYQALKTHVFADNAVFYEPNLPEHEAAPDQRAIYLGEKASHERALHRLHQLFMYADSDMSETDYFAEKSKLEAKINDITQKLAQLESEETSEVSSEYFSALVSNFILENNLNEERYIDYFALKKKIDPMELKLFLIAVLSKCFIRQGRVASIIFQNGYEHRFIYKDKEAKKNA